MDMCDVWLIIAVAGGGAVAVALVPRGNVCRAALGSPRLSPCMPISATGIRPNVATLSAQPRNESCGVSGYTDFVPASITA